MLITDTRKKSDNINRYKMYDNCGSCGHWKYLWIFENVRKGWCKIYRITTSDQGWCKTHTAYTEDKD